MVAMAQHPRMWGRLLIVLIVVFGVLYYLNQKKAPEPVPASATPAGGVGAAEGCYLFAQKANAALTAAAAAARRLPVDQNDWSRAERDASSAITAAESACGSSGDATKALGLMRLSLGDLALAARGEGGATGLAARQGEIDTLLNRVGGR